MLFFSNFLPQGILYKLMCIFVSVAVYKASYKSFGGFALDVVAPIDQVYKIASFFQLFILSSTLIELIVTHVLDNKIVYMI